MGVGAELPASSWRPPESNDIAIRKWQSAGLEWLIRRLIWTVARLQQSKNFNRRYLIGPCLHTFR
jgi:hypothetical protein